MKVKEIMSSDVACVRMNDSVETAAQLMGQYDVGSIPVCDQDQVVGIITDRDIALRSVATGQENQRVGDIMSADVATGEPNMDVHDAARVMSERQIRRLPIVDNGRLVGIVALGDLSVEPALQDNAEWALKNISQPQGSRME
jgi:CBS domain-containing protein